METYSKETTFHEPKKTELSGFSVAERMNTEELSPEIANLIELEKIIPVTIGIDTSLRPKILDECGMTCVFCHNEGTPISKAYNGSLLNPNLSYHGGRVSAFQDYNMVNFLPGTMHPGKDFETALAMMANCIGTTELHLTGGEPTLHKNLPELINSARNVGYSVKMTSNGENGSSILNKCASAGLEKVNFSIFGTTPKELSEVQNIKYNNVEIATLKLNSLQNSIDEALKCGLKVDANIVMANSSHAERVLRIIDKYDDRVSIRILNDIDAGDESYHSIYELLAHLKAKPTELYVEAGSSNSRVKYTLENGRELFFKQIRRVTLPSTCSGCNLNNDVDCKEGHYGIRLYIDNHGNYKAGVCLQRMDLTINLEDFCKSNISDEIIKFRETEYNLLTKHYKNRIIN